MSQYFWESTQKARKEHFCDFCGNWIQPGQVYRRVRWHPPGRPNVHTQKEHYEPDCPQNYGEERAMEMMKEEREALGVPVALEARVTEQMVTYANGSTGVESRTELFPIIAPAILEIEGDFDPNEEIPF